VLVRDFKCHPALPVFPGWHASAESAAYQPRAGEHFAPQLSPIFEQRFLLANEK
jgi:hypothetical protein